MVRPDWWGVKPPRAPLPASAGQEGRGRKPRRVSWRNAGGWMITYTSHYTM